MPNLALVNRQMPAIGVSIEFAKIRVASQVFGVSRSSLYRLAATHPGLLLKLGGSTIVDIARLRGIIAGLPAADIRGAA